MFEFYGLYSQKVFSEISKKSNKRIGIIFFIPSIVLLFLFFLATVTKPDFLKEFVPIAVVLLILNLGLFFLPHNSIVYKLPKRIVIDNTNIVETVEENTLPIKPKRYSTDRVKLIFDYGDWYQITFKGDFSIFVNCEKNLLIKGTIDEFENFFKDKIVKKYKTDDKSVTPTNNTSTHKSDIDNKEVIQDDNSVSQDKIED